MESVHVCLSSGYSLRFIGQESVSDTLVQINKLHCIEYYIYYSVCSARLWWYNVYACLPACFPFSMFIYSVNSVLVPYCCAFGKPVQIQSENQKRPFSIGAQFELVLLRLLLLFQMSQLFMFFLIWFSQYSLLFMNALLDWLQYRARLHPCV